MMKTKKSNKGLALVLAAVLALTPMAGFPITALATGDTATQKAEAPAIDAGDAPAADAGETPQADAPATDADVTTDATPGTTPSTPAPDAETPQAEAPATDAGTNPDTAGSATNSPAANVVTPDLTPTPTPLTATPTVDPAAANDGVVNEKDFPDKNFWKHVQQDFDKNKNKTLEADEIKAATWLNVSERDITTLQGIEYLTDLTNLDCSNNNLTTLNVSANIALRSLHCYNNKNLTTFDVPASTALRWLRCDNNNLTTLDISHNPSLMELDCSNNNNLTPLNVSANPALTFLDCNNNNLTTLNVSANPNLTYLDCSNNNLTTLNVSANIALTKLVCESNQLTTLDLKKLTQLSWAALSPQRSDVVIPVIKRDVYEVDTTVLPRLSNVTVDGKTPDADGKVRITTLPNLATYTFEADSLSLSNELKTVRVETKNFAYSYLATLDAGTNGTLIFDGTPSASGEILLAEKSEPTFTVTPASGYQVATLTVNGEDAKEDLVAKDATSQTLPLLPVTDAVTIAVTFEKIPAPIEPPVDPADPINPPTPPAVPDNGGNNNGGNNGNNGGNNGGGGTTIVERTNTVFVPAAPQAAALAAPETPATPAAPASTAAKTEVSAKAAADNAGPQGQLENPALGAQGFDTQHSHIPLALLLLAVWLVGGFAVIRQRKHTHDEIEGTSY